MKTLQIPVDFDFEEIVYVKTDVTQQPHMVLAVEAGINGGVFYICSAGGYQATKCVAQELSREKNSLDKG